VAALLALGVAGCGGARHAGAGARVRTVAVERRDLVARATIDGELGYAAERTMAAALSGTLTWLAPTSSVVRAGGVLYRVDDEPVVLLYGPRPAWRALTPGIAGRDVRALERNLRRLGYDPYRAMTVDKTWTSATTRAVERLQEAVGLTQTGSLELGRVVFTGGPRRVSAHPAAVGDTVATGHPALTTTSTRREVVANLSTDDQGAARADDRVTVDLPDGGRTRGRITSVGAVATTNQDGSASIKVVVRLPRHGVPPLDQAPVSVSVARERRRGAVAIPVVALVARDGGGYGVELVTGARRRIVGVSPGLFADGWVQVDGLRPGERVAVPQ
jgi:peptidoglycan hydrolase-like protein with peptidoglycan-binding domain